MIRKIFIVGFCAFLLLSGIFFYQQAKFNDNKLHVIFCDVGQGDGILIRTPAGQDILLDGGPDESVLSCLSNHTPFWDRTIELMILSHPHADHLDGLIGVLKRYSVLSFVTEKLENKTAGFKILKESVSKKKVSVRHLYKGDAFRVSDGVKLDILGPTKEFLRFSSPNGIIGESGEFSSLIVLLTYKNFQLLFTGDSQESELREALAGSAYLIKSLDVFQVPHHGSKTGLSKQILNKVRPRLVTISVGRKNKYGHPSKEIIKILRDKDIKILRTDEEGEIEIVSDGDRWEVWNNN